jgi:apolipoprotein D and lipocalin family protein
MLEIPNYHIIDSDYENYSIVYSCSNTYFGYGRSETAWILSRDQVMDEALLQELIAKTKAAVPNYDFDYW